MCGIFGHNQAEIASIENSHAALNTLTHRGPDNWGYELCNGIYLGHRRLSILDLSEKGRQPMLAQNVYLTVNGEIYNYKELRRNLIDEFDVTFTSESDSEVLLHGYIHWGINRLLQLVDGMFALSIYDVSTNTIILARDHVGIKPIYYWHEDKKFAWASELKAIESYVGKTKLSIDSTAVYDFMTYLYVPCPKTVYQNVFKLEPGHYVEFDALSGELCKTRYWELEVCPRHDVVDWGDYIREAMSISVKSQLVSDVPVGFFLSGGVDSSVVCFEASKTLEKLQTFSIGHMDKESDESPFARMVAKAIGSTHLERFFSTDVANNNFELLRQLYDEPFGDVSALPTNEVCRLAREHVTVVLTGDGGDELFGGYVPYANAENIFSSEKNPKSWIRPLCVAVKTYAPHRSIVKKAQRFEVKTLSDPMEKWAAAKGGLVCSDPLKRRWAKAHNIPADYDDFWYYRKFDRPDLGARTRAQFIDFHTYMHDSVLTKVDRASMAVALETRVPFLSKKMISAAWSIPEEIRYCNGDLKGILKQSYDQFLPHAALYRRKQGFSVGRIGKKDRLYDRAKNVPKQILQKLFPELLSGRQV
ncbi:asparagine synthase (glutamine-hydrolyzing) [Thalassospira marina]|nr:asparagine synthase (glutamine-hydrolyzing) [Thalassospira marina]